MVRAEGLCDPGNVYLMPGHLGCPWAMYLVQGHLGCSWAMYLMPGHPQDIPGMSQLWIAPDN